MYLVVHKEQGMIIDPGFTDDESERIIAQLNQYGKSIPYVLLTHAHFDHIIGCQKVKKTFKSQIYCHPKENEKLTNPVKNGSAFFGLNIVSIPADKFLDDNQNFSLIDLPVKIIYTPGHSKGSLCILLDNQILFSGDTLMKQAIGRTDLKDGDFDEELNSITQKILTLPETTIIYPGHGPATSVKEEKIYFPNNK